jgi:hypothetical protein
MGEKGNAYRILMGKSEGKNPLGRSDIHMSMHRNIITNYSHQDATFLEFIFFTDALHVSGGFSAHHQEHITVHTASGIVNQYCC